MDVVRFYTKIMCDWFQIRFIEVSKFNFLISNARYLMFCFLWELGVAVLKNKVRNNRDWSLGRH